MASTRLQLKKLEDERKSELAIDALRIAMMNREQVPAESVMNLQGVARPFQNISAYNSEFGRRVNDQLGPNKVTRLMYAAFIGDEARVLALIRQGARRNLVSTSGKTALYYAVQEGHINVVRILLEAPIPFGSPQEQPILNSIDADNEESPINKAIEILHINLRKFGTSPLTDKSYEILRILINAAPPGSFANEFYLERLL
jgi:ankyrin repeat protein